MKKLLYALTAVAVMFGAVSCDPDGTEGNGDNPVKTVSVGAQDGVLKAGVAGSVSFAVTTANIADGQYTASVENLPAGLAAEDVVIAENTGVLTLSGTPTEASVIEDLILTVGGAVSSEFTLTVVEIAKTVTVGEQEGILLSGKTGAVTYAVTVEDIADAEYTVSVANLPSGVTAGKVAIAGGEGTLTLSSTGTGLAVIDNLCPTLDGTRSNEFTLTVKFTDLVQTLVIGAQSKAVYAGKSTSAIQFPLTSTNVAIGQAAVISAGNFSNLPGGVQADIMLGSISGTIAENNGTGSFILKALSNCKVGTYDDCTLTVNGATAKFTLVITEAPKVVAVGVQTGKMTAGLAGSVTYAVSTDQIANGEYTASVANLPAGVTAGKVTIAADKGTLTLSGTPTTDAVISNLKLTLDGTPSNEFTLTIVPLVKTVAVGAQSGTLDEGKTGSLTFSVTTENIAAGDHAATVTNLPAGMSVYQDKVAISATGTGTLTLVGSASTVAGTTSGLVLTLDGTESNSFSMKILSSSSITIPDITFTVGTAKAPALYYGSCNNVAGGEMMFDADASNFTAFPTGITLADPGIGAAVVINLGGAGNFQIGLAADGTQTAGTTEVTFTYQGISTKFNIIVE